VLTEGHEYRLYILEDNSYLGRVVVAGVCRQGSARLGERLENQLCDNINSMLADSGGSSPAVNTVSRHIKAKEPIKFIGPEGGFLFSVSSDPCPQRARKSQQTAGSAKKRKPKNISLFIHPACELHYVFSANETGGAALDDSKLFQQYMIELKREDRDEWREICRLLLGGSDIELKTPNFDFNISVEEITKEKKLRPKHFREENCLFDFDESDMDDKERLLRCLDTSDPDDMPSPLPDEDDVFWKNSFLV
jgi:hypothetical protein